MSLPAEDKFIRLRITGDPDGTGTREAVFEWTTGDDQTPFSITETKRTETRTFGGTPLTLFSDLTGVDLPTENADVALDFGSSTFALELGGVVYAEQQLPDGSECRWGDGDGGSGTLTKTDAQGCLPAYKSTVLSYWLRNTRQSSVGDPLDESDAGEPATLETLQYRPDGVFDPIDVILESPSMSYSSGTPTVADIQLTAVEVASLDQALDALANDGR
ncbi:hypothetical protein [Halolamina rubra]|uniref:hypothetical protein n=1 Tax=Halolamina rubra TaxID=1380430 RepID=UPI0006796812|nr:hypothetical protein [Halolamina rubra]